MGIEMNRINDGFARRYTCDVLVIGAGVSGYCAAIQAGRLGCRTILIEKDTVLGGNAGPNVGVGITGADRYNQYGTETGLIHELQEEAAWVQAFTQVSPGMMPYNISRRNEAVVQSALEAAGVIVLKQHYARMPVVNDAGWITGLIVEDLAGFHTVIIEVNRVVIEASGDGEIGLLAGADYDSGSEAKSEFFERSAPEQRNNTVQGTSLVAIAQRTGHEVLFIPPPDTPTFTPRLWFSRIASFVHHHDGWFTDDVDLKFLYVTEAGGTQDTVRDDGQIYEILLKQLWAEWDHIKNGPHREAARCWDLLWVSPKAGKRESRRLLGDVILTQSDLENGRCFPDDIAYGGHDLDDHKPIGETADIFGHSIPPLYGIPYRACYSRNVPNLLLAGRLISATHLA
ncbi:MAG: FAD-dependent oxidoreductase, partial [Anaerolineales bacterium]